MLNVLDVSLPPYLWLIFQVPLAARGGRYAAAVGRSYLEQRRAGYDYANAIALDRDGELEACRHGANAQTPTVDACLPNPVPVRRRTQTGRHRQVSCR